MSSLAYRADIDGLRTLAVVPVVLYHAGFGLSGGFVGVDVFFVISGYLITSLLIADLDAGRFSLPDFYERRARRIFPALFVMIAATIVLGYALMIPSDFEAFGKSVAATTVFGANIWFYLQVGYFTEAAELKPLLHTWSLGVEEQYYVVFPLVLWLAWRVARPAGVFAGLVVLAAVSLVAAQAALRTQPDAAFYLPHLRAWELLAGSLLALAVARRWLPAGAGGGAISVLSLLGLAAILGPVVAYGPETPFPGLAAVLPCLGATIIIATGGMARTPVAWLLSLKPMVFIGKLSYSLYLWHWPPIAFVFYKTGGLTMGQGAACVLVALLLSYLSWRFVEQPFRNRARISGRMIFTLSAAAMTVFVAVGGFLAVANGLPGRGHPDLLAHDAPDAFLHDRRDCHFVDIARARSGDVCVRGAAGAAPTIMLVGDSHADAFSPAFFAAAESLGLAGYQYTNAGFRPLVGVSERDNAAWGAQSDALVDFLEARPEITTIYVTAYWQHQMTGYTYRHTGDIWRDDGYDGSGTAYNLTATLNGLTRFAARLPDRHVVLLDDVPSGSEMHVRTHLRRDFRTPRPIQGMTRAAADAQRAIYEPHLRRLAAEIPNVSYQPVFTGLCDAAHCPLFAGSDLLFRDGDHLSHAGALSLTDTARGLLLATP